MSPAVRETLRDAAVALALEPPEPVDDATDPGWEAVVLEAEAGRQGRTAERVTTRFVLPAKLARAPRHLAE